MLSKVKFLIFYYLLWVAFFVFAKSIFLFYHYNYILKLDFQTTLGIFINGIKMDFSFSAYLSLIPFLLITIFSFVNKSKFQKVILKYYTYIFSIVVSILVIVDLEMFRTWGYRVDASPLKYFKQPKEAFASMESSPILLLISILLVIILVSILIWKWFFKNLSIENVLVLKFKIVQFLLLILLTAILIIPIRGGFQLSPINQSSVYFSKNNFANQAAINPVWNFFDSIVNKNTDETNPFLYLSLLEAKSTIDSILIDKGSTLEVLNNKKPNIIIITYESFTAKILKQTGGLSGILPEIEKLVSEGILFTNCFATGDRSEKGIIGILSGFPAQPTTSIMNMPAKTAKLPSLPYSFQKNGYTTAWYYGGEAEFANIKSYLVNSQFDQMTNKENFPTEYTKNTKWGAPDHLVLNRLQNDLKTMKQPFFVNLFTLSSHEPFNVPMKTEINGNDENSKFLNAHRYTDKSIGTFIKEAKKQAWWPKTLIIIIADHGHRLPEGDDKIEDFHIPMLWLGGALAVKNKIISDVCSQNDLAKTLIMQLKNSSFIENKYVWSKNIFSEKYKPSAYFAFNNGFGFLQANNSFIYDNTGKTIIRKKGNISNYDLKMGKAYLQMSFADFLSK